MMRREFLYLLSTTLFNGCFKGSDKEPLRPGSTIEQHWSLDLGVQKAAQEEIVSPIRNKISKGGLPEDADLGFVCMHTRSGDVLAYVPTLDPSSEYDCALRLNRDCASTGKAFIYAVALERGAISPGETFEDSPMDFPCDQCPGGVYSPSNYGNNYSPVPLTPAQALAYSSNVIAMKVYHRFSDRRPLDEALAALGLPAPQNRNTAPLGWPTSALKLCAAYTVFGNRGYAVSPRFVTHEVVNGKKILAPVRRSPQIFRTDVCDYIREALRGCLSYGTGRTAADLSSFFAGKTGTSSDAWAVLFGSEITCALWIGRRTSNRDIRMAGGRLAMPALADFIRKLKRSRPDLIRPWR